MLLFCCLLLLFLTCCPNKFTWHCFQWLSESCLNGLQCSKLCCAVAGCWSLHNITLCTTFTMRKGRQVNGVTFMCGIRSVCTSFFLYPFFFIFLFHSVFCLLVPWPNCNSIRIIVKDNVRIVFIFMWISVRFSTMCVCVFLFVIGFFTPSFCSFFLLPPAFTCLSWKVNRCCSLFFGSHTLHMFVFMNTAATAAALFSTIVTNKKIYIYIYIVCSYNKPIVVNCSKVNQQNCSSFNEKCVKMLIYMLIVKYINLFERL